MPSHVPRHEPIKKREELSLRRQVLENAILNKYTEAKLNKAAERYRTAQLALFKATIHLIMEKDYQNKTYHIDIKTIENKIAIWTNKTVEIIIEEVAGDTDKPF